MLRGQVEEQRAVKLEGVLIQQVEGSFVADLQQVVVVVVENQGVVMDFSLVVEGKVKLLEGEKVGKEEGLEEEILVMEGVEMKLEVGHWQAEEP